MKSEPRGRVVQTFLIERATPDSFQFDDPETRARHCR
ncbi:MAG: hypothetical protein JWO88_3701, partial [Frankiales bacterium]|nr:hypothetical protein [Frankiales bacterium]